MNYKVKNMVLVGIFSAIVSIFSILTIPTVSGVPVTLQTFAVALCGYILGAKKGAVSILIYILIGIIGFPVFSGMRSGITHVMGLTGGFILGFIFMAFFCGYSCKFKNRLVMFTLSIIGLILCNIIGVVQYSFLSSNSLISSFITVSLPFLPKDIISIIIAMIVSINIKKVLEKII